MDDGDVAGAGADGFEVNRCSERSALDRESEMESEGEKFSVRVFLQADGISKF